MQFLRLPEFNTELKKLLKRYHTLEDDLTRLESVLVKYPRGYAPVIFRVNRLGIKTEIYKVKNFRCKALKYKGSRSGIRVIYAYLPEQEQVKHIEIYYKEKDNIECNKGRILRYFGEGKTQKIST
jgi:hypothetical protein